jgi:hypothetical protein
VEPIAARRDKRSTWALAVVLIGVLFVAGIPVVEAASQKVRVTDSKGGNVDSAEVPPLGLLDAPGSTGALATRAFAGGGGLLGTAACDPANPRGNTATVAASETTIVTALILTGNNAALSVSAPDLDPLIGPGPVVTFQTNANNPNEVVALGNGLTVFPSELVFTCTGGDGNFVILGQ